MGDYVQERTVQYFASRPVDKDVCRTVDGAGMANQLLPCCWFVPMLRAADHVMVRGGGDWL